VGRGILSRTTEFARFRGISTFPHSFAEFGIGLSLLLFSNLNQSLQSIPTKLPIFLNQPITSTISKTPPKRESIPITDEVQPNQ